jgi:probable HAF family extracellular repeat protein
MRSIARSSFALSRGLIASDRTATTFAMKGVRKRRLHKHARLSVAAGLFLLTMAARAQQPPMEDIGQLQDGIFLNALGISGDGAVIVGNGNTVNDETHAFRYDLAGGMSDLGKLIEGRSSFATGVSADGAVIVGYSTDDFGSSRAFRYVNGVVIDIDILENDINHFSKALAVSSDGKVIVGGRGSSVNNISHAFRYDPIGGMTQLNGELESTAYGVSADGALIVGYRVNGQGQFRAFRYDTVNGMTDLKTLGGNVSAAFGVSADGAVIVGYSNDEFGKFHAFRNTNDEMKDLGTLGGNTSSALGVSANGRVIVGNSTKLGDAVSHAFKVVGDGLMTDLGTLGGNNSTANGVSADGAVIVGQSDTIFGVSHAFIYRNIMVDVPNTYAALGTNAGQLAGLLNVRHAVLGLALQDECNSYSVRNVCVSAGGRSSRVEGGFTDTAAQLQLGYRISPQLRIGASLDQGVITSTPGNYVVTRSQPLVALYAAYALTGTSTGLQLKASVAQGSDDVGITRSVVANTEAGHGNSALTVKGMQLEAGWGWTLGRWQAMSFAGVKDMRLSRAAYTETSGADFPVSYQAVRQSATTAYAGLQASSELAANLMINLRGGVEHDLRNHQDLYVGTIESLSPFAIAAPTVQRTRAFAAVGSAYRITPTQQISIGVQYSQQPLQQANGVTVMVRYSAAL